MKRKILLQNKCKKSNNLFKRKNLTHKNHWLLKRQLKSLEMRKLRMKDNLYKNLQLLGQRAINSILFKIKQLFKKNNIMKEISKVPQKLIYKMYLQIKMNQLGNFLESKIKRNLMKEHQFHQNKLIQLERCSNTKHQMQVLQADNHLIKKFKSNCKEIKSNKIK